MHLLDGLDMTAESDLADTHHTPQNNDIHANQAGRDDEEIKAGTVTMVTEQDSSTGTTDVKLLEARSAILLWKNDAYASRHEPTMWILDHMFRPLTTRDYDDYQLLLLSASMKPAWERKKYQPPSQERHLTALHHPHQITSCSGTTTASTTNEAAPTPPSSSALSMQPAKDNSNKMYIITPRTRILNVSKEHCMVFVIDLSSSLATIETSTGKVMIGSTFTVLENIIQGLVKPFSIYTSESSSPIVMEHLIRITVIAECSQFGSNMNVIPILAEYPTMRVLLQNTHVYIHNVTSVLKTLKETIDTFKKDLGKFRKKLTTKRSKMGYELDVREDHAQSVAESVESSFKLQNALDSPTLAAAAATKSRKGSLGSTNRSNQPPTRHARNKSISSRQQPKKSDTHHTASHATNKKAANTSTSTHHHHHHHHHHSHHSHHRHSSSSLSAATLEAGPTRRTNAKDKKDVWGVGKTGSSLSYILRAGSFALSLLPKHGGQSSLILLTDGVVKSNIQDESVIRHLTAQHISCSVVQIGQDKGFFPGLNFGFVPDNEILEFVAQATNGIFSFAEQCPSIMDDVGSNSSSTEDLFFMPPNIYHHRYMLKEVNLDHAHASRLLRKNKESSNSQGKSVDSDASSADNAASLQSNGVGTMTPAGTVPHFGRRAFPWDPMSIPIAEDLGKLKFKEYFLPTECWHFMRARLRQGFVLQSVSFIDEPKSAAVLTKSATNTLKQQQQQQQHTTVDGLPNFQRKQNVVIVFILRWQPTITVQYSIKALWTSSLRYHLKSMSVTQEKLMNIPEEPPNMMDSDNIFSCMRAPKAEIVIKSTSTFSHMLHNWDQFQRRSQMMAVQGGHSTVDLASAPGFIKVGKMKRLLERLADTDSMLKQLVQFNIIDKGGQHAAISSQYDNNSAVDGSMGSSMEWSSQLNYIQKFSSHWAKLERSELRVFNACWYDEHDFNVIMGDATDCCKTNAMDVDRVQVALNLIYDKLHRWSTFISDQQQVYIKLLNVGANSRHASVVDTTNHSAKQPSSMYNNTSHSGNRKHVVPQFCEVRVVRETDRVLLIKMMFFNTDIRLRHSMMEELQDLLQSSPMQDSVQTLNIKSPGSNSSSTISHGLGIAEDEYYMDTSTTVTLSKRPLSSLLMRDSSHFLPSGQQAGGLLLDANKPSVQESSNSSSSSNSSKSSKALWSVSPSMQLTGEFLVRNYLYQYSWHWDTQDVLNDKHMFHRYFSPIIHLAFDHIMAVRSEQKWNLIAFNKSFAHFYKEISFTCEGSYMAHSAQYFIWKDMAKKRISTELWLEPMFDQTLKLYDPIKAEIFDKDKSILSQLITFDVMYLFGKSATATIAHTLSEHPMEVEDETRGVTKWMQKTSLFNMASALKLGQCLFALYPCPNYNRHFHPEGSDSVVIEQQQQQHQESLAPESFESTASFIRRRNGAFAPSTAPTTATPTGTSRSRTVSRFSPIGSPLTTASRTPLAWHSDKGSTTCTCPRPDELFCTEKDDISKLRPVFRDMALLHYYVEQSLSAVTDRSMSLNKTTTHDDFWPALMKEIFAQENNIGAHASTLLVAQNFRDLQCFIKLFDPSVFIVILMPRLDAIVKGLCKLDHVAGVVSSFERMGLMMFECQRQDKATSNQYDMDHAITVKPIDLNSSKDWLESLRSTLRPSLSRGYLSGTALLPEALSDRTLRLMQDVAQVYSRSFVKSIFTCLLHGRAVDSEDFEKVIEICDESNLDIDLTGYLNVQTLLKRRSRTSEQELISANQRFISVLGHYFEPVIISNTKWSNMYCYRPPFAKVGQKLGLSLSSGEKPSNLADVVVCAQNPLFVRLDCTLRKPAASGVGFEEITFPLKSLPVLYEGETESGMVYNYEPESIGTKFSPVDSADGTTATLHLVCMTLPQSEYDPPNALFSHKLGCPADSAVHHQASFLDAEKTHRARLPSLSQDKQDALVETEARLTWLFTEEIMHGLLRSGPITQNVIRYIEAQLKKKNPFVDFPTTMFIPLAFVKNQRDSRRMFFEQLEKHDKTPYRLVRVGDCFYASDNGSNSFALPSDLLAEQEADKQGQGEMDETMSLFDGEGLNITTDRHKKTSSDSDSGTVHGKEDEEQQSDEFCHGLGISILEPETPDEDDSHTVKPEPVRPQLYWLLLIPQAQNVQIYFYSKMQQAVNRSEIIRVTKSMVNEVMERTNKMSLLQYLHETRRCSKYLLASAEQEKSMYSSCEESSDEDDYAGTTATTTTATTTTAGNNLVEILSTSGEETTLAPPKKFLPGQFSCDLVFTKRFPLHWRLAPNSAYNKLMTDTLPPFLVQNKPGMFVCSHQDAVVYCFLSEVTTTVHSAALSDSMNQSFLSATNADDSNSYYMANPESPYGGGVSLTTAMTNESDVASNATRARYPSHVYNSRPSPQGSMTSDRQQFSPRQSPSLTDAGASASSPIAGRKPGTTRHYEGRELLLEVYGVEMDYYIVDGLVEMINSRITSEITLKEVQQFLVRNPNSKLSRADMDFILPVEKEPLVHRQLSVPGLIENTVHFLKILRKNILTGSSLHVLHSNYLPAVLKKQHDLRYASYDFSSRVLDESGPRSSSATTDEWSCLDFAFYYNYLNRAPGTYLPLEQKIGEGVAGICLSVLDSQDIAYRRIISEQPGVLNADLGDLDTSPSRSCLSSNFEDVSDGGEKVKISIDIWSHCKINVDQIYRYIYDSFRQSICDYIIENTVLYLPLVKYDDAEFKSLSTLLLFALKKAAEWESSTVKQSVQSIKIAPWYLDGITMQLKSDLLDVHPSLDPIVARAAMTSTLLSEEEEDSIENFKLYNPSLDGPRARKDSKGSLVAQLSIKTGKNALWNSKGQQQDRKLVEIPTFDNTNYRYLVISGLPEQSSYQSTSFRRSSAEIGTTEPNHRLHARGIYFGSMGTINAIGEDDFLHLHKTDSFSSSRRDDNASLHSRQESLASSITKALPSSSSNVHSKQQPKIGEQLSKDYPHQHSFIVFTMDSDALCIYAYNCSDRFVEHMYNATIKNVLQQETRHMGLNNILHQKLGLFHHSDTMVNILSRNLQEPASPFDMTAPPALVPATPLLQHNAITQVQQIAAANSSTGRSSPSLANTIGRLVQMDSSSSIPSIDSLGNSSSERRFNGKAAASTTPAAPVAVADFESLQHLVTNNYEYKNRTSRMMSAARLGPTDKLPLQHSASVLDIYDNTKLCKSSILSGGNGGTSSADPAAGAVFTAVRGADANTVLRDVYADSTEDNRNWYDKDYLLRHGEPYLEMYLARSKPLAAHEKAFKVYTKWADQYYGPGHTKTIDEMMTVDELKQILKASRLLHFCRTPLIFSGTNSPNLLELSNNYIAISGVANGGGAVAGTLGTTAGGYESLFNKLTVSKSEEMTAWYERLSRGFMREYASYLESIGMHLIVYGPSNDQQDEMEAYLSSFTITEDYAVNSPVVYLLQVFEGGSIMCEVRLTGAFVSVTLYTLHRRYGRLQFSPYSRQRKRKEIGRENFQKFMTECDQFKQRIHVNSFVFDFHLRYIQRSLDDVELLPPNLNLLSIIKNTVSVYDRPAIYARNRIINGLYEVAVDDSLGGLTAWFMNTGSKLGLKTLKVDGVPVACFVSSDDLSFESQRNADENYSNEDAPFRYTLIMCPAEKSSTGRWRDSISVHRQGSFDMMGSSSVHKIVNRVAVVNDQTNMGDADLVPKIHLQYFILVTYRGMDRCTSSDRCQRAWSKVLKDKPKRYANFLNEVLSPETFTLNDVFESAKKKMDHIVNKAVHFFHREADWNTLYEIVRPNLSKELPQDLVRLALKFNPIQLGDMDPAFNKFLALKGVNWNDVLDNLKLFYMMTCGDIQIKDTRHVLLFIPNTTFFHFVYTPGEQCQVSINSKEDRSTSATALTDDEKHHVSNLATSLSYYLWKRIR